MTVKNTFIISLLLLFISIGLVCIAVFKPWQHALTIPINYFGDSFFSMMIVKNSIQGSFWSSPQLGIPYGMNLLDFISSDSTNVLMVKILGLFSGDSIVITHLFFWLSFFTTGTTASLIARKLHISDGLSMLVGLLFAFTPYHLARNIQHLFLGSYFVAPLIIYLCIRIFEFQSAIKIRWWLVAIVAWLSATTGLYYAYFSFLLVGFASTARLIFKPQFSQLKLPLVFISIMAAGLLFNFWPSLRLWQQIGSNPTIATRLPSEAENNGFKLYQLSLPLQNYGISLLSRYHQKIEKNLEAQQYMGIAALVGLVLSILLVLTPWQKKFVENRFAILATAQINIFILLVGMSGGLGSFIALLLPQIRAYSRLLPFLVFGCLILVAFIAQSLIDRASKRIQPWVVFIIVLLSLGSLGDQVNWYQLPSDTEIEQIRAEQAFIETIENLIDSDSKVYQLPYKPFPESAPIHQLEDYDLLKGYLFSSDVTWSYGTIKGREGDLFYQKLSQQPIWLQLATVKAMGFEGVYIDRTGYSDYAKELEASISALTSRQPLVSENGTLSFFDIR